MNRVEEAFLTILASGLKNTCPPEICLTENELEALLLLADQQDVLPLIFDVLAQLPLLKTLSKNTFTKWQNNAICKVTRQIVQTNEFLTLILHAQEKGIDPIVLKGIIVRSLYPRPFLRPSVDEDIFVDKDKAEEYHNFFLSEGLIPDGDITDFSDLSELSYHRANSPTYIEMHMVFFDPDSAAYGELDSLFEGSTERTVCQYMEDVAIRTLSPTDHLLYLICHAYKHFLYSGVGVRQICDIGKFTDAFGAQIDWNHIGDACRKTHMEYFAAALWRIAEKHLGFIMPLVFSGIEVDETDLLSDMLSGGSCGNSDLNRLHSSNITLEAVAAERQGRAGHGIRASLFPSREALVHRYPYLKQNSFLLPIAWAHRIINYLAPGEKGRKKTDPGESIRIGESRVELLKEYGIITSIDPNKK